MTKNEKICVSVTSARTSYFQHIIPTPVTFLTSPLSWEELLNLTQYFRFGVSPLIKSPQNSVSMRDIKMYPENNYREKV